MKSLGQLPQERQLYWELLNRAQAGQTLVRATLVHAWGSTPREVGAKMLIYSDGSIHGTIGGGCGEAEVWQEAQMCLVDGQPRRVEVDLTEDEHSHTGKVCGGRFEVFLDRWGPDSSLGPLRQGLNSPQSSLLLTCLGAVPRRSWRNAQPPSPTGPVKPGAIRLLTEPEQPYWNPQDVLRPRVVVVDGVEYFLDPLTQGLELVIAGAGHIARPLAAMASLCGYRTVVVDDRDEYARPEYFPGAQVVCTELASFFQDYVVHAGSHVVLVTRGHKHDEECLRQLAGRRPAYLGMIGSRRRARAVFEDLQQEGIESSWLDMIYSPVGLDLGALTPEEIAVSILSEMILLRRGGNGGSLGRLREVARTPPSGQETESVTLS